MIVKEKAMLQTDAFFGFKKEKFDSCGALVVYCMQML